MTRRASASFPPKPLLVAYNGTTGSDYSIGLATSPNFGLTWLTEGVARLSGGSGWEANGVKDACLFWDAADATFVMLYAGYTADTSQHFQIGRATATSIPGTWTKYASNPVLAFGSSGDADHGGCCFPVVYLDGTTLRVWYTGFAATDGATTGIGTVCYAESTDYGKTFTKHGTVIGAGTSGAFNDIGTYMGCVYKSGSTFYIYVAGLHNPGSGILFRSAYCTTTNPSSAGSYSTLTQLSNYTGSITTGGKTWQDNMPRNIIPDRAGAYACAIDLWNPTDTSTILESCARVTSPDLTSWASPTSLMLPFDSWSTHSAENPSVIVAP